MQFIPQCPGYLKVGHPTLFSIGGNLCKSPYRTPVIKKVLLKASDLPSSEVHIVFALLFFAKEASKKNG
jgi:hypothetical protein